MKEKVSADPDGQRLVSLDVLRGFDMFWILGMEAVGAAVARATGAPWAGLFSRQMEHAAWEGFHFIDLIFPLFIFISGVSLVFSADKSVGLSGPGATALRLLKRAALLYLLGLIASGGFSKGIDMVRWLGVLQRIAICGLAAGLAYLYLTRRSRILLVAGLLAGYWLMMRWIPVPGIGAGDFSEGRNLANWLDQKLLPGFKYDGTHDPEGLLSTLPAIATALLGVLAGEWLKHAPGGIWRKAGGLAAAGLLLAAAGWAWHPAFPVIKKIWTSTYVLVAGGYSLLLLATFLILVDAWKIRRGLAPFIWIGMNPITLYLSINLIQYGRLTRSLLGGPLTDAAGAWGGVILASGSVLLSVGLAWFLYSRKIFLRV